MMRSPAALLAIALLAASPQPAASPPAAHAGDRVAELIGSWTCRNPFGVLSSIVYRAERGGIVATETSAGGTVTANDFFTPVPSGGWTVERAAKYGSFSGYGLAWTTSPWNIAEPQKHGAEIRYERIDDRTLKRTFHISGRAPYAGEVCAMGDDPPDPALCAVRDVPATVVNAVEPDTPPAAVQRGITGKVDVLVSLDAEGHVTAAAIEQSPSVVLNAGSLVAARLSRYQPALHDCKPVPSEYTFTVEYSAG
jgi:TonB family protein